MTKLLENIFRSVNIALVNELAILADRMGIDIWEVVDAAATKPYGFMRFEPGPGMGGHCLPVDPFYLTWRAREFHMSTEFIELAGKINQQMPYHCVERIERALNDVAQAGQGLAHRCCSASATRAASATCASRPRSGSSRCSASAAPTSPTTTRSCPRCPSSGLQHVPLETRPAEADAVVLVTAHPGIDHAELAARSRAVRRPPRRNPRAPGREPRAALSSAAQIPGARRRIAPSGA